MMTFIQAIDFRMWLMVELGYNRRTYVYDGIRTLKPANIWTIEERECAQLNAKVLNCFICTLKSEDYMRVSTCSTGKEIWDRLCLTYRGTGKGDSDRSDMTSDIFSKVI